MIEESALMEFTSRMNTFYLGWCQGINSNLFQLTFLAICPMYLGQPYHNLVNDHLLSQHTLEFDKFNQNIFTLELLLYSAIKMSTYLVG